MHRWFSLGLGAIFLAAMPVQANEARQIAAQEARQIAAWRSELYQAVCAERWAEASAVSLALVGTSIPSSERIDIFALRQDLFAYQQGTATFPGCVSGGMPIGVTAQAARLLAGNQESGFGFQVSGVRD